MKLCNPIAADSGKIMGLSDRFQQNIDGTELNSIENSREAFRKKRQRAEAYHT